MAGLTLAQITAEVREVNIALGWRPAEGGPGSNTFGDYIALLHSEASEALEAYRDHRLADATADEPIGPGGVPIRAKPEGVGAELADVLIRLVDMCDVFGIDLEAEVIRKVAYNRTRAYQHGGRTLAESPAPTQADRTPLTTEELTADVRLAKLLYAMPTDPRDWWSGADVADFTDAWKGLRLPPLTMQDATDEVLTLWTSDLIGAAERIGLPIIYAGDRCMEIRFGEYVVRVGQSEKETGNGA